MFCVSRKGENRIQPGTDASKAFFAASIGFAAASICLEVVVKEHGVAPVGFDVGAPVIAFVAREFGVVTIEDGVAPDEDEAGKNLEKCALYWRDGGRRSSKSSGCAMISG